MTRKSSAKNIEALLASLKNYVQKEHFYDLEAILQSDDPDKHYAVSVNTNNLFEYSIEFAKCLFTKATLALELLDRAFKEAAQCIIDQNETQGSQILKEHIHARLTSMPSCTEIYRPALPKCSDVNKFLCISGTVVRVTIPKMMEYRKTWRCTKCKYQFNVDVKLEDDFMFVKPPRCENPEQCFNQAFSVVSSGVNPAWCKDFQEMKVQERVHHLEVGTVPRSMWVVLDNDLVDICQAGNNVMMSGILQTRWQPLVKGARSDIELVLHAHNVEVKDNKASGTESEQTMMEFREFWQAYQESPLHGRDFILSCFCPQVYGLYIVKLAVCLVLAGGVQRVDGDSSKIRGDSHLLLVGDPGTGKSQFLKYAAKVCKRSVLTSGIGTTNAGLTVAAVKEGGKWHLEAGALVLADGGICCIDEFNSIKEQDKASIHEAMEQQTISVAKAGLVCKLKTECSILAATNPKGKYNKNESLSANTAMASPLLSRFDIIIVLLDTCNEEWDRLVSSYILEGKDMTFCGKEGSWTIQKMRKYFSVIKTLKPRLTPNCDRVLQAYYKKQRSMADRSAARTTPRLLQSLVRLAQGHARLMFRLEVLVMDAVVAISVIESSMQTSGLFQNVSPLHSTFPEDPVEIYKKQATTILKELQLEDILEDEAVYLGAGSSRNEAIVAEIDPYASSCQNISGSVSETSDDNKEHSKNQKQMAFDLNVLIKPKEGLDMRFNPEVEASETEENAREAFKFLRNRNRDVPYAFDNGLEDGNKQNDFLGKFKTLSSQPNKATQDASSVFKKYVEDCISELEINIPRPAFNKRKGDPDRISSRNFLNPANSTVLNPSSDSKIVEDQLKSQANKLNRAYKLADDEESQDCPGGQRESPFFTLRKRKLPKGCNESSSNSGTRLSSKNSTVVPGKKMFNLSNDVTTLSQLNAAFDDVLYNLNDSSVPAEPNKISKLLKGFAFKSRHSSAEMPVITPGNGAAEEEDESASLVRDQTAVAEHCDISFDLDFDDDSEQFT